MPMAQATPAMGMAAAGSVTVNGMKIAYRVEGKGQPLILIHGYPLSGELFARNRAELARNFMVITPDLPGFGDSTVMSSQASIDLYATTMLGFMDAMKIQSAVVGGMSMGGITLLDMYRMAPQRFKGLVLIDTIAAAASIAEADSWRGNARQAQAKGVASLVPGLLPRMLTGPTRMNKPGDVAFLSAIVKKASLNGAVGGANALADRPEQTPVLATITVPTLIVVGAEDNVTPVEIAMMMNKAVPGSTLVIIPAAGHAATFEKASAMNAAMLNFAKTIK